MFEVAQTNLQLYRQMNELGYSSFDRERVAHTYRFLMPMFSGLYRGTEKPFLAHLVGTASILAVLREPIELLLAGMLHAVYMAGDFGFQPGTRQTNRKRRRIRELAGPEAEAIVAAYDDMRWNLAAVRTYLSEGENLPIISKSVLILHLANTLEDFLDYGMNYCQGEKRTRMSSPELHSGMLTLSRRHAGPEFSARLEEALSSFSQEVPPVDGAGFMGQSALVLPPSSRRKLLPTGQGWFVRRLRRLKSAVQ